MPLIVTIGEENFSTSVAYFAEAPEVLEDAQYVFDEADLDEDLPQVFKLDGTTVRQATAAEMDARIAALQLVTAARDNRRLRDFKLGACDWVVTKAAEAGETVPAEWVTYRQALRDITEHTDWPHLDENDWPVSP